MDRIGGTKNFHWLDTDGTNWKGRPERLQIHALRDWFSLWATADFGCQILSIATLVRRDQSVETSPLEIEAIDPLERVRVVKHEISVWDTVAGTADVTWRKSKGGYVCGKKRRRKNDSDHVAKFSRRKCEQSRRPPDRFSREVWLGE